MSVELIDNSVKVKGIINDKMNAFLHEVAGEIEAQTKRGMDASPDTDDTWQQTKNSFTHHVDETKGVATIGSPSEKAFWYEFGTGSHALYKNGRKGWWIYVKNGNKHSTHPKTFTQEEAEYYVARMRKKGLDAYASNGREPLRMLETAFIKMKAKIIRRAEEIMRDL